MAIPAPSTGPIPSSILQIEGDPTSWGLRDLEPVDPHWGQEPVALAVLGPLFGTLLLSPSRIGSFALTPPLPGDGWIPAFTLPSSHLYIPTPMGVTAKSLGYMLAASDNDLAALQQRIMNTMSEGTSLTVNVTSAGVSGVVVLNGAELPFAALGPANENS
jgi:hypothetical protein